MTIWRTCKHCNSKFPIDLPANKIDYNHETTYCPFCNMNKAGVEKPKDNHPKTGWGVGEK